MKENVFIKDAKKSIDITNISMADDIFSEAKAQKNKENFLDTIKKCPICGVDKYEDFRDHVQEHHFGASSWTAETFIENKINEIRRGFKAIRAFHYWLQIQGRRKAPNEREKKRYIELWNELNELKKLADESFSTNDI